MSKVKIFVCCHKASEVRSNEVYVPLNIGRAELEPSEIPFDMIGDDTGDNISDRGSHYNEATGIYWIWKNVHDVDYVGLSQYRRSFKPEFTNENIDLFFDDGTDVILSKPYFRPQTRWYGLLTYIQMEDYLILRGAIKKICPEYLPTLNSFLRDYVDFPFNMVVCRKSLYDKYAEWMFSVCFEMEKYIKYSGYANGSRLMGYITEFLTPLYFIHNKCKIKGVTIVFDNKELDLPMTQRVGMFLLHNTIWRLRKNTPVNIDPSFYRGLIRDGITIDCN